MKTGILNRVMGFKPYKTGNKTGWMKTVNLEDGLKNIYQKLPSGTVVVKTTESDGFVWSKKILKHNGGEIRSDWSSNIGTRRIQGTRPNQDGFYAVPRLSFNSETQKYDQYKSGFYLPHVFTPCERLKMRIGLAL